MRNMLAAITAHPALLAFQKELQHEITSTQQRVISRLEYRLKRFRAAFGRTSLLHSRKRRTS